MPKNSINYKYEKEYLFDRTDLLKIELPQRSRSIICKYSIIKNSPLEGLQLPGVGSRKRVLIMGCNILCNFTSNFNIQASRLLMPSF